MKFTIEPWSAEYGAPVEAGTLEPSDAAVDVAVELKPEAWRPLRPDGTVAPPECVEFIDGVRRIEARVWITDDDGTTRMGICASYAAGRVRCAGTSAQVARTEVRRGLFAPAGTPALDTRVGPWPVRAVASDDIEKLKQGVQERMAELERELAGATREQEALLVLDGPLTGKLGIPGAVGYVKTHRVAYLPETVSATVARLSTGERTPLFVTQSSWSRYSWYLRLPGPAGHPWSGVVRCEASADLPLADAVQLADVTACTLPRFASKPHKDARAPQNLYPIAGLERELRHRLGDAAWILRAVRAAASA